MYTFVDTWGSKLYIRELTENGETREVKHDFKPSLFLPTKEGSYEGLLGGKFEKITYDSISDMKDSIKHNKGVVELHGMEQAKFQYIKDTYPKRVAPMEKLRIFNFDIENKIVGKGINVNDPKGAMTAITVYDNLRDTYFVFATHESLYWKRENGYFSDQDENIEFVECFDEIELLEQFIRFWKEDPPHILTGWNIVSYDIPYLVNRIKKILGDGKVKKLSPFNMLRAKEFTSTFGMTQSTYIIQGIGVLDYIDLYKKFTYKNRESYKLDHIAEVEIGQKKLDYSEYNGLNDLYEKDFQKYIDYNIQDVRVIKRLNDKMKLIELAIMMAYDAGVNPDADVFSPVKVWDSLIFNYAADRSLVIPPNKSISREEYGGGFVKVPKLGFSDWVLSFDLTSLYPHLIMGWNISPETLIESFSKDVDTSTLYDLSGKVNIDNLVEKEFDTEVLKDHNVAMSPNGCFYSREKKGLLSNLIEIIFSERKTYKGLMLEVEQKLADLDDTDKSQKNLDHKKVLEAEFAKNNNMQMTRKILMNSLYGCLGNPHFRYTNYDNALAITSSGQLAIKFIEKKLNQYVNKIMETENKDYCIAIDTDSVYFEFKPLVDKHMKDWDKPRIISTLDKLAKNKMEPYIDKCYRELADYMNCYEHKLFMDREVIAEKAVWTAKKRYAMTVWDSEGVTYETPKLKIMGLEVVKSSTPAVVRDELKESLRIILSKDESSLIDFVETFKDKFYNQSVESISFPRGINDMEKYQDGYQYKKGTPIHVKAAINYNNMLNKKSELIGKYDFINSGDKIKFIKLKLPNPIHDDVIGFVSELPKDFGIHKYIDYDLMWEKTFLQPLKVILDSVDWKHERASSDLEAFFI